MTKKLRRILFKGLIAILPAVLTIYILYWMVVSAEKLLGGALEVILPQGWYWPGMGLLAGVLAVFCFGLMLNAFLVQKLLDMSEAAMNRIPLIKTLYGSVKDFIGFFAHQREQQFNQVVTVELQFGDVPMRMLGFVTRTEFDDLPPGIGDADRIAVYLPLSYQIGGYTVIVPRTAVKPVNISMHRAMGFAVTGGMFTEKNRYRPKAQPGAPSATPTP